jgi:L-asparagine transporter-like permease
MGIVTTFLQVQSTLDITQSILWIVVLVLAIVVLVVVAITALTVYIKVNRAVNTFNNLVRSIGQIPNELRLSAFFGGLGSSLYGFASGFKDRVRPDKDDDDD